MVRELVKAEQARGALLGTPGSVHTRHGSEGKQYGPGFFGGRGWKWGFILAVLLTSALFVGFIIWNEARHSTHSEESGEGTGTHTPGAEDHGESHESSGALGVAPADVTPLSV